MHLLVPDLDLNGFTARLRTVVDRLTVRFGVSDIIIRIHPAGDSAYAHCIPNAA